MSYPLAFRQVPQRLVQAFPRDLWFVPGVFRKRPLIPPTRQPLPFLAMLSIVGFPRYKDRAVLRCKVFVVYPASYSGLSFLIPEFPPLSFIDTARFKRRAQEG